MALLSCGTSSAAIIASVDHSGNAFSLFHEDTAAALIELAEEGAIITLPGSDDTYTFVSNVLDTVTWATGKKDISVTIGSGIDEDGKTSKYTMLCHSDAKRGVTRSLKQVVLQDGKKVYSISKTDKKGTVEFSLTAEQFAGAEQQFSDPKSFDLLFNATQKRESTLYMFSQETFDYLEKELKSRSKVKYPGKGDTYIRILEDRGWTHWSFNNKGLTMSYGYEKDEEGKKKLTSASLYSMNVKNVVSSHLYIDYSEEGEPSYYAVQYYGYTPREDGTFIEMELTVDQFTWAVERFAKNPKNFNQLLEQLQK